MKKLAQGLLLATVLSSQAGLACKIDGSEGFLPENKMNIPVGSNLDGGITEDQFNEVINKLEAVYTPIVAEYGGNLKVSRRWTDGTVNAYAEQYGKTWSVSMFGGLARHNTITPDGFALVVCHELGHHIGGVPRYSGDWASSEGQSDYFATLKCLRRIWQTENNTEVLASMTIPEAVTTACASQWEGQLDQEICARGSMAGDSVAKLFMALNRSRVEPKFDTPDPKVVTRSNENHPASQCRLDTYFQGALCAKSYSEEIGQEDEISGACHGSAGDVSGLRPLCWFKPNDLK